MSSIVTQQPPYYQDDWLTIWGGDCRDVMAQMPDESVQMVCTSPPYLGLRDYGIEPSVWGGEAHEHEWATSTLATEIGKGNWAQGTNGRGELQPGGIAAKREPIRSTATSGFCPCGAWLGVLGLEPTVELYVAHMVEVFRGLRRVLRKDGTLWLNLGDSYFGTGKGPTHPTGMHSGGNGDDYPVHGVYTHPVLKPKDRMMVPARVAIALQADGWFLRDEIVWAKPNPMPSSVTDRTTPAHEMVYLLTRSARYFSDFAAIAEPAIFAGDTKHGLGSQKDTGSPTYLRGERLVGSTRNKRSVWTIPTAPYPEAHFATFPPKLIKPMILAGTSERGCCPECGAPWERETEVEQIPTQVTNGPEKQELVTGWDRSKWPRTQKATETTGWHPSCVCLAICGDGIPVDYKTPPDPIPCTVLDPFGGSGTVGMVSRALGRKSILIDLSQDYCGQMLKRATASWDREDEPVAEGPAEGLWQDSTIG